jgi:pyruvate carboxylase
LCNNKLSFAKVELLPNGLAQPDLRFTAWQFSVDDDRRSEQGFSPDTGKLLTYRSASGFGIRLDAGSAFTGAVISHL